VSCPVVNSLFHASYNLLLSHNSSDYVPLIFYVVDSLLFSF